MVTIRLPDESYERARERAAELGVDVETFIAAAVGVFASRIEFKGERMRDHLYEERLARDRPGYPPGGGTLAAACPDSTRWAHRRPPRLVMLG
ncbi:MAG: hypothetical protein U5Q44_11655 [Dehalococcoidia bacterium]|nr:hypothetical protein [Dehalococcoidia bacterium]